MDPYLDPFMKLGGSMISLAKGNRSQQVTDACKKYGGFYLGSIGGPAAVLAKENIKKVECPRAGHGGHLEDRGEGLPCLPAR